MIIPQCYPLYETEQRIIGWCVDEKDLKTTPIYAPDSTSDVKGKKPRDTVEPTAVNASKGK
ncbi:MAG: hypothetical protein ACOYBY_17705 [Dermatophilaceae bacterium]